MFGEKVIFLIRAANGIDELGNPVYAWEQIEVENCLVRPLSGSDAADSLRPDGVRAAYSVAVPKTYDGPSLKHARACLVARGMDAEEIDDALWVSGSPDITVPCPTYWNMIVEVGRMDG